MVDLKQIEGLKLLGVSTFECGDFKVSFFEQDPLVDLEDPVMVDVVNDLSAAEKRRKKLKEKGEI